MSESHASSRFVTFGPPRMWQSGGQVDGSTTLPGIDPTNLEINIVDGTLRVRGERCSTAI